MSLAERKQNRAKGYDYGSNGAYFVTVCTKDRKHLLWTVGETIGLPKNLLSDIGKITDEVIQNIPVIYQDVRVDKYTIMPNHVHMIIVIMSGESGRSMNAPTVSRVIQQFKGAVTKKAGFPIWQRSFHDHIIRNEQDYLGIWEYINNNPVKWREDCYYQ